jgi:hypothetical protein
VGGAHEQPCLRACPEALIGEDRIVRTDLTGGNAQVVSTGADTPEGAFGGPE